LEFTTFPQFLSMVIQRISWKASNRGRDLKRKKRSEDVRVDVNIEELQRPENSPSPMTEFAWQEDKDLLMETILAMPNERDRKLILGRIEGLSLEEMAASLDLEIESARRALNRALERVRVQIEEAKRARGDEGRPSVD
jgi:RNA polymerase sigma factor (sigma-70 family)